VRNFSFQDLGQFLAKKVRECKLCKLVDIKNFLPKVEQQQQPVEMEVDEEEVVPVQPVPNRKKRSSLPMNIDDYEKRRSARSVRKNCVCLLYLI